MEDYIAFSDVTNTLDLIHGDIIIKVNGKSKSYKDLTETDKFYLGPREVKSLTLQDNRLIVDLETTRGN